MKKLLLSLSILGIIVCFAPVAFAQHAQDGLCQGLKGAAFGLCKAYCDSENQCEINPNTPYCEDLRKNNLKINGKRYFPCDQLIACGICADIVNASSVGECEEVLPFECQSPSLNMGAYSCSQVMIPASTITAYPACQISPTNMFGIVPLCQNSIPEFVCTLFLKGTVLPANSCPAAPSCME